MDKKKIIVFWDNKGIAKALKENKEFIVCGSQNEFHSLSKKALKEARGFLVLCELNWNHKKAYVHRTEFGGIRLVQRFIRDKMNLKAPVVFTSNDTAKNICEANPENKIIRTPALKHFFVDIRSLDNPAEDLYHCFDPLEGVTMTDTELAYTKLLFCDTKGLIVQINHVLEGRSKAEQDKYRKDIEYVLKEQFNNDEDLMEQYRKAKDLSDFCKILITRFEATDTHQVYDGFLHEKNHKTIRILLLEDELEKDKNVERFVNYIKEFENKATAKKTDPLFRITVVKNMDDVAYNKMAGRKRYCIVDFDVVICDIEIRNEQNELVTLGFNVIEKMAKETKRPLYYIVTNVSRSFYDQIKVPYVRRIRLKKEVFGTKRSIETFLYGIKEVYDNREAESVEKEFMCEVLFDKVYDYINKDVFYPTQIGKPFIKDGSSLIEVKTYDDIEKKIIKVKSLELIKHFLTLFSEHSFGFKNGEGGNFDVFHENCEKMRDNIKATIGLGNGNLDRNIAKREKNNQALTTEDVTNFIIKLVMRRFFLYVVGFIDHYELMKSFDAYKNAKKLDEDNRRKKITYKDVACRAISDQFMAIEGEIDNEERPLKPNGQSHCLDETLLFAKKREVLRLTKEERDFVDALDKTDNVYSTSKSRISKLRINY